MQAGHKRLAGSLGLVGRLANSSTTTIPENLPLAMLGQQLFDLRFFDLRDQLFALMLVAGRLG